MKWRFNIKIITSKLTKLLHYAFAICKNISQNFHKTLI